MIATLIVDAFHFNQGLWYWTCFRCYGGGVFGAGFEVRQKLVIIVWITSLFHFSLLSTNLCHFS